MSTPTALTATSTRPGGRDAVDTRLHGRLLVAARVAWLISVAFMLGVFIAAIPIYVLRRRAPDRMRRCRLPGGLPYPGTRAGSGISASPPATTPCTPAS